MWMGKDVKGGRDTMNLSPYDTFKMYQSLYKYKHLVSEVLYMFLFFLFLFDLIYLLCLMLTDFAEGPFCIADFQNL